MYDFQKANMWKRISAALLDFIFLCIVVVGVAFLLSAIFNYDGYIMKFEEVSNKYEQEYGVDFDIPSSEYQALTEAEREQHDTAAEAFSSDTEANRAYGMIINLTFLIIIFSLLFGYVLLELVVPLIFKNGQTLGKKVFGVAVMRRDGVKVSPLLMFARTVLGKYTLETMVPVFIIIMISLGMIGVLGIIILAAILIAQIVLLIATKARTPLHDMLAQTVTVDYASQMIFESPEELLAYKKKIHAEKVDSEKN